MKFLYQLAFCNRIANYHLAPMTGAIVLTSEGNASEAAVQSAPHRLGGLDGLRALAAIAVIFHHVGVDSGATFRQPMTHFLARADIGVSIFFVLSGFLLYRPFVSRLLSGKAAPNTGEFWLKRFVRLYPAYWVALAFMLMAHGIAVKGFTGLLFCISLTHNYHPRRAISGITQTWSLTTEIAFYAVLPFFHRATVRSKRERSVNQRAVVALVGLCILYAVSVFFRGIVGVFHPHIEQVSYAWFPARADTFALGMALAVGEAWGAYNPVVARLTLSVSRRVWGWYGGALVLFWFMATQLDLATGLNSAGPKREAIRQLLYGLIAFAVVLPMAWKGGLPSLVGRLLDSRIARYLGVVSYGIYLWHQWVLHIVRLIFGHQLFGGYFWPLIAATLLGSTAIAALSHRFIEQPAARFAPKLLAAVRARSHARAETAA